MDVLPQALFWDVDREKLDLREHSRFVIERILQFGRPEDLRWLISTFEESLIADTVRSSRRIDRKTGAFWALHFGISTDEVACLNEF